MTLSGVTFKFIQLALAMVFVLVAGVPMLRRKAPHLLILSIPTAVMAFSGLFFLALMFPCHIAWSNFFTLGLPSWGIPLAGAAHLLFAAALSTVSVLYVPALLSRLWLVANGLLCLFPAVVLAEEHP